MAVSNTSSVVDRAHGSSVLDMIGRTPLVRLHQFERETPGVELYAKAEWQNPGGSVKDRAAARMILEGEASGKLTPDKIIIEMERGYLLVCTISIGCSLGVLASKDARLGTIDYEMAMFANRASAVLTPQLIEELRPTAGA